MSGMSLPQRLHGHVKGSVRLAREERCLLQQPDEFRSGRLQYALAIEPTKLAVGLIEAHQRLHALDFCECRADGFFALRLTGGKDGDMHLGAECASTAADFAQIRGFRAPMPDVPPEARQTSGAQRAVEEAAAFYDFMTSS